MHWYEEDPEIYKLLERRNYRLELANLLSSTNSCPQNLVKMRIASDSLCEIENSIKIETHLSSEEINFFSEFMRVIFRCLNKGVDPKEKARLMKILVGNDL
jgi:hypothetical protein